MDAHRRRYRLPGARQLVDAYRSEGTEVRVYVAKGKNWTLTLEVRSWRTQDDELHVETEAFLSDEHGEVKVRETI